MKTSLLLVSLLILTACNDNQSQTPVTPPPVVTPPLVEPPVEPPIVVPPTEPPIEPAPTHTRTELALNVGLGERLGAGATLVLRQLATGIEVTRVLDQASPLAMTLPPGLLLDQPLELVGTDGSYILRASSVRVADLAAGAGLARRVGVPALRLDEEATALFLLADQNGDGSLSQAEWGRLEEIRLQQQAAIQDYATLLLAQRQPGAELNYPDSWQMLLALRDDKGARSWYRRSNSGPILAAQTRATRPHPASRMSRKRRNCCASMTTGCWSRAVHGAVCTMCARQAGSRAANTGCGGVTAPGCPLPLASGLPRCRPVADAVTGACRP